MDGQIQIKAFVLDTYVHFHGVAGKSGAGCFLLNVTDKCFTPKEKGLPIQMLHFNWLVNRIAARVFNQSFNKNR